MAKKQTRTDTTSDLINQARNRQFSEAFKRQRVSELLAKKVSIGDVSRLYGVTRTTVYRWIYLYSDLKQGVKTVVEMESEAQKTAYYRQKLAELERMYGQKQLEVDYLNKVLELASEEMGYDLKKKFVKPHWNGFEPTPKNTPTA